MACEGMSAAMRVATMTVFPGFFKAACQQTGDERMKVMTGVACGAW